MEPTPRVELGTSFLPRMRSATELCGLKAQCHSSKLHLPGSKARNSLRCNYWCREEDSNLRSTRRQIYSLLGLTAPQSLHRFIS